MSESPQSPDTAQAQSISAGEPIREESSYEGLQNALIGPGIWRAPAEPGFDDKQVRIRTASVIRAARKGGGFSQQELAAKLGITQGALSKIEAGLLLPSMVVWFSLCKLTRIDPSEAYETGTIDRRLSHSLKQGETEGRFKLPTRYASDRGSSVRSLMPLILFFREMYGEQSFVEFVRSRRIDPDYFVILDNQLNVQFSLDVITFLLSKKVLRKRLLRRILEPVSSPLAHGRLHREYDAAKTVRECFEALLANSSKYEVNFSYQVEKDEKNHVELSVRAQEHMRAFEYQNEQLGTFFCDFRKEYLIAFSRYAGRPPIRITESQCQHRGADKCIYHLDLEASASVADSGSPASAIDVD